MTFLHIPFSFIGDHYMDSFSRNLYRVTPQKTLIFPLYSIGESCSYAPSPNCSVMTISYLCSPVTVKWLNFASFQSPKVWWHKGKLNGYDSLEVIWAERGQVDYRWGMLIGKYGLKGLFPLLHPSLTSSSKTFCLHSTSLLQLYRISRCSELAKQLKLQTLSEKE